MATGHGGAKRAKATDKEAVQEVERFEVGQYIQECKELSWQDISRDTHNIAGNPRPLNMEWVKSTVASLEQTPPIELLELTTWFHQGMSSFYVVFRMHNVVSPLSSHLH